MYTFALYFPVAKKNVQHSHVAIPTDVIAQHITGIDGLKLGDFGCPGSEVTFTCRTSGSQAIAWRSNEYIGSGNNQLGMVMGINRIGDPLTAAEGKTVAMLTQAHVDGNGVPVLESTLRIVVTSFPNPSVTCTNGTDLGLTTFRFTVPGESLSLSLSHTHTLSPSPSLTPPPLPSFALSSSTYFFSSL